MSAFRIFDELFKKFVMKHKEVQDTEQRGYLQHKRLIAMVDMRPLQSVYGQKEWNDDPKKRELKQGRDPDAEDMVCF